MLSVIAYLSGCASNSVSYKKQINNDVLELAKKYSKHDSDKIEIAQPIAHIFSYLKSEYSQKQWKILSERKNDTTKNLETNIQDIYGKSLYRIAGGEMQFKERYPFDAFSLIDTFSVGFVKVIAPNRIDTNERSIIISQLKSYTHTIDEILSLDPELKERFEYGLKNMRNDGKIPLILATNPNQAKDEGLKRSYAITNLGYYQKNIDTAIFTVRISTKYFGLISTSTMMHELVHAIVGIIQQSPSKIAIPNNKIQNLQKIVDSMTDSSQNMMIVEGIAESISQQYNPMYNSGYFNTANENINWQVMKYGHLHDMESAGKCYNGWFCSFDGRILALYEANSFVNYLIKEYGYPKVIRLAMCSSDDSNFISLFGKGKDEIFDQWRKTLMNSAKI